MHKGITFLCKKCSGALFKHLVIASLIKFEIYSLRMAMLCRGTLTAKEKNKSVDALWSS